MLNPDDRFYIWQDFSERIRKLFSDVEDELDCKFAPFNAIQDKDTPYVSKLFDLLADLSAFVQQHTSELEAEYSAWEDEQINLRSAFTAWSNGLCPIVMIESRDRKPRYVGDAGDTDTWEEISNFKQQKFISKPDTQLAVMSWELSHKLVKAAN